MKLYGSSLLTGSSQLSNWNAHWKQSTCSLECSLEAVSFWRLYRIRTKSCMLYENSNAKVCGCLIVAVSCLCKQIVLTISFGNEDMFVLVFHRSHVHDSMMFAH